MSRRPHTFPAGVGQHRRSTGAPAILPIRSKGTVIQIGCRSAGRWAIAWIALGSCKLPRTRYSSILLFSRWLCWGKWYGSHLRPPLRSVYPRSRPTKCRSARTSGTTFSNKRERQVSLLRSHCPPSCAAALANIYDGKRQQFPLTELLPCFAEIMTGVHNKCSKGLVSSPHKDSILKKRRFGKLA